MADPIDGTTIILGGLTVPSREEFARSIGHVPVDRRGHSRLQAVDSTLQRQTFEKDLEAYLAMRDLVLVPRAHAEDMADATSLRGKVEHLERANLRLSRFESDSRELVEQARKALGCVIGEDIVKVATSLREELRQARANFDGQMVVARGWKDEHDKVAKDRDDYRRMHSEAEQECRDLRGWKDEAEKSKEAYGEARKEIEALEARLLATVVESRGYEERLYKIDPEHREKRRKALRARVDRQRMTSMAIAAGLKDAVMLPNVVPQPPVAEVTIAEQWGEEFEGP